MTLHEIDTRSAPHGPTPCSPATLQTPTDRGDSSRAAYSGVVSPPVTCMIEVHHRRVRQRRATKQGLIKPQRLNRTHTLDIGGQQRLTPAPPCSPYASHTPTRRSHQTPHGRRPTPRPSRQRRPRRCGLIGDLAERTRRTIRRWASLADQHRRPCASLTHESSHDRSLPDWECRCQFRSAGLWIDRHVCPAISAPTSCGKEAAGPNERRRCVRRSVPG